jgi:ABC-type branched-subunit amino acid transport system substrate-binding protein
LRWAVALTRLGRSFTQIASDNPTGQSAAASFYNAIKARGGRFVINDTPDKAGTTFIPVQARDLAGRVQRTLMSKLLLLKVSAKAL